ncbi:hypothetical protein FGO68_gene13406 [Halteria grandinella]|uniref:Uncharacterized protein n=1 Tax=Halteria grandinella TaxID=5974 RepID=A0A8J8T4R4_HALGN|nr:hypothetical protein FGO68_gene13406 [Halteria grandinella]
MKLRLSKLEQKDYTTKRMKLKFTKYSEPLMIPALNYLLPKCSSLEDLTISFEDSLFDEDVLHRGCKVQLPPLDFEGKCYNYHLSRLKKIKLKILGPLSNNRHQYKQENLLMVKHQIHQAIEYLCKQSNATLITLKFPSQKQESPLRSNILQEFMNNCLNGLNGKPNIVLKKLHAIANAMSMQNIALLKDHFKAIEELIIEDGNRNALNFQVNSFEDIVAIQSLKRLTLNINSSLRTYTFLNDQWDIFSHTTDNLQYLEMNMPILMTTLEMICQNKKAGFIYVNRFFQLEFRDGIPQPYAEIIEMYPHIRFDMGSKPNYLS